MPRALLATLLVLVRLIAPAMAQPPASSALTEFDRVAKGSICHTSPNGAGDPGKGGPAGHADCLQCPACHLSSQVALPVPVGPVVPAPVTVGIRVAAPPPPATGPPGRVRGSAQPTGPPILSA